jgi:photosystem II stability/assembly factor-like uncharacterized protein
MTTETRRFPAPRSRSRILFLLAGVAWLTSVGRSAPALAQADVKGEARITTDTFGGLWARSIGPATMSGRIAALDAVATDPLTVYVGAASGGLWRTKDSGNTFIPIFDKHTQSIGAVRVDPTDPKILWVGTGESWVRNSVSIGDGVYKSTDGGDNWAQVGLKDSERIARIQIDPKAHDTVWVCATGQLWNANEERGVFKTTDGGKTWKKVLYVDADTGCSDLAIDPQEPRILYAGMWTFRRSPDFFVSGGKGSGLYKSTDGGESWQRLERGLPKGELGRIGLAVAPSRAATVYAIVESKEKPKLRPGMTERERLDALFEAKQTTALYRSDDAGASFAEVSRAFNVQVRPFYFATVIVDPKDHLRVYKPGLTLTISNDGGKSFNNLFTGGQGGYHSDIHALWIHPERTNEVWMGTDGGVYVSKNRGGDWVFLRNLPLGQFYKVAVDDQDPYRVYGGLQDNSSWVGPSESWGGIENSDWTSLSGGDGFATFPDARDPQIVYTTIQGGVATRVDLRTGESKDIKPYAEKGEKELRFNWNTGFVPSPNDPSTIYIGAQVLLRSKDRGDSWERISPDLTTNDPQRQRQKESGGLSIDNSTAENNTTIYTISESPRDPDVVWVGTDDGNVQLTRDGGQSWTNRIERIPGAPRGAWISRVVASRFDAGTAYVTIDDHRRGDRKPYLFRTRDFGATWESLARENVEGYAWVMLEDSVAPNLLFLGTEWGLWISLDGGAQWARFEGGLPAKVAVHDLALQERAGDLVIATHGRSLYILDDLTPLRALSAETLAKDVAFLPARPAELRLRPSIGSWFGGNDEFVGSNPSSQASIVYWMKKRHLFGDLKVEVYGEGGKLLATIPGSKRVGINRVGWATELKPPKVPPAASILFGGFVGPRLPEGTYRVKLIKGKETLESTVTLGADPRNPHSAEDRKFKQQIDMRLYDDIERLGYVGDQLVALRDGARKRAAGAADSSRKKLESFAAAADKLRNSFVATGDGYIGGDEKLREHLGNLYGNVVSYEGRPSPAQLARMENLEAEIAEVEGKFAAFLAQELAAANRLLAGAKLEPLEVASKEEWKSQEQGAGGGGPALSAEEVEELLDRAPWLGAFLEALSNLRL